MDAIHLSMVLPVYNEAENIRTVHNELQTVLQGLGLAYEIIYVDDGSRDGSADVLRTIAEETPRVRVVLLRRNFGQTAAIQAGIDQARGTLICLMDADYQNDPAEIPRMYARMNEGFDLVSGWRKNRQDRTVRRIPSIIANRLISVVTGVHLHDYGCTLKMYRHEVLDHVRLYGEMHRFIPVLAYAAGARIDEMVVNHRARLHGSSKYTLWRTIKVVLDLMTVTFLTKYNTRPMYIFGGFGFLFNVAGLVALIIALLYAVLVSGPVWAVPVGLSVLSITLMALGLQNVLLGLLIEMLMRTYYEAQGKGPYAVREVLHSNEVAAPLSA